ncbi:hypothetical protein ABXN37_05605 [Piscinibacter sakaiensis]|uniref:hypothetical protein n=1 Tax=Piscinibacter sakaiensis TaxID=1547922 RepID=UPI00372961FC
MKKTSRHLIAAAVLAAFGGVAVASPTGFADASAPGTRADVMAEAQAVRHVEHGSAATAGEAYGTVPPGTNSLYENGIPAEPERFEPKVFGTEDSPALRGEAYGYVDAANGVDSAQQYAAAPSNAVTVRPGYETLSAPLADATMSSPALDNSPDVVSADARGPLTRQQVLDELMAARASGALDARGELSGDIGDTKFGNLPNQAIAGVPQAGQLALEAEQPGTALTLQPGDSILLVPVAEEPTAE